MMSVSFTDKLLSGVFVLAICLPLLTWVTGIAPLTILDENRPLAAAPGLPTTTAKLGDWTTRFTRYYDDHFGFRNLLLRWQTHIDYALLRSGNKVLVGKDGWLFLERGIREDIKLTPIIYDLCGQAAFSAQQLDHWVTALETNQRNIEQRGGRYIFMVVPNKHTLYPQYLPEQIRCKPANTRLNQLRQRLTAIADFPFLDITPQLAAAALTERVYNQTDTHWNGAGVRLAYDQLVASVNKLGLPINDLARGVDRLQQFTVNNKGGDLAQMLGLGDVIHEQMIGIKVRHPTIRTLHNPFPDYSPDPYRQPEAFSHPNADQFASVLVFHDSFIGKSVKHLLAETFGNSTFVWNGHPALQAKLIAATNADLVIHQTVERALLQPFFDAQD